MFPEGEDPRVQQAAEKLARLGIAEPVLFDSTIGFALDDERVVRLTDRVRQMRPDRVHDGLHARELAADPLMHAAGIVALGEADGVVAGAVRSTTEVLRSALWMIGPRPGVETVTAAMYHGLSDGRILTFTDIAVVPLPTVEQLVAAATAAAADRQALIGDTAIVAFLSYSTHGSAGGPEVERVSSAAALFRQRHPEIVSDGELQLDAALVPRVAARKCPDSPVAGCANILVFPSLDAANIGYKLTERLAGASAAGPLLQGLAQPMTDLSRGAEPDDIVDVAALVALQARAASPSSVEES